MPRKARIDAPGALHHIIIRGIEKKHIFRGNRDKDTFIARLGPILSDTLTTCYAWALMSNHVHLLLRTGLAPIATVMRRLLTGYAQYFNRRHTRHGQLFQNRYKSILCEEDPYFLELVRYIHLNPVRARLVEDTKQLRSYPYSGYAVLMGKVDHKWQETDYVLGRFGKTKRQSRMRYASHIAKGVAEGKRPELVGGGLVRSIGGWAAAKANLKKGERIKGDERILGSSEFVEQVLKTAEEQFEESTYLKNKGLDIKKLLLRVTTHYKIDPEDLICNSKQRHIVAARAVLCYLAVRKLKTTGTDVARLLNITPSAVSKAVNRGQAIVRNSDMGDLLKC
ncbi:MAG: transposase [Pseudomonadota bacterium]